MANFPVYHGITLAQNAYIENLNVEILATDPSPVSAGRIWYNSTAKVFKQSTLDGTGAVVVRTYATKEELDAAVSDIVTALAANVATLNTTIASNISSNVATLRSDVNTYITANVSTINGRIDTEVSGIVTALSGNVSTLRSDIDSYITANVTTINGRIDTEVSDIVTALSANVTAVRGDIASNIGNVNTTIGSLTSLTTTDTSSIVNAINSVKAQVGSLGNAFNYVGTLNGGATTGAAYDLSTLATEGKDTGDYYKVAQAGYFKVGAAGTPFYANVNDGLVWNAAGGIDKIDNTDSSVTSGDTDFIDVTGSADTGFVVNVGTVFAGRVTTLETDLASEITRATTEEGNIATALSANVSTLRSDINSYMTANVSTINGRIDTEVSGIVTALSGNVSTLRSDINSYMTANVSTINGRIDTEVGNIVTALSGNVSTINSTIGTLGDLTTTSKGNVVAALNEINSLVAGGTADVRADYDATIWTYASASAATSHTLTHNLNSQFVDFGVMIQRGDGSWYNDIASIQLANNNSATLYLSSALNVRVIARSAATISL